MNLKFKKHKDNEYFIAGKYEYLHGEVKEIEMNGEVYKKNMPYKTVEIDLEEEFRKDKKNVGTLIIDHFELFGVPPIVIYYNSRFGFNTFKYLIGEQYSSNEYVQLIICVFKQIIRSKMNRLDLPNIYYGKKNNLIDKDIISLPIYSYGFNNVVEVEVYLKYFLEFDFSKLTLKQKECLKLDNILKKIVDFNTFLPEKLKTEIALEFLYKQINQEKKWQNH